jgi:DNA-binding GntR family transcriptional regulator
MPMFDPGFHYASNEDIYNTLRREILNLTLAPGQALPENDMAKRFGVSRTPIRSVFERLKADNFIEVFPRRGTFVTLLDLDAIEQIIYLRTRVETGILLELSKAPDRMLLDRLAANLNRQKRQLRDGIVPEEFYQTDSKFHEICFRAGGKGKLWDIILQFMVHYTRYRMLVLKATGGYQELLDEHIELYELLRGRRSDHIEKRAGEHLRGGIVLLGDRLTTEFGGYFVDAPDSQRDAFSLL